MRQGQDKHYLSATPLERRRARWRRERWARTFRPESIDLLIVAEAPPESLDRYFYFPHVWTQDALFRYVIRAILRVEPSREIKRELLERLRESGVFLVDVSPDPLCGRKLNPLVPGLIRRIRRLKPKKIILLKANVYDVCFAPLLGARLPVVDARIRFPGRRWQGEFVHAFRRARRRKPATQRTRSP